MIKLSPQQLIEALALDEHLKSNRRLSTAAAEITVYLALSTQRNDVMLVMSERELVDREMAIKPCQRN